MLAANAADVEVHGDRPLFWQASSAYRRIHSTPVPGNGGRGRHRSDGGIETDRVWEAQPALMAKEVSALRLPQDGHSNLYCDRRRGAGLATALSRGSSAGLKVAGQRFGSDYRGGVLLSNAFSDLAEASACDAGQPVRCRAGCARSIDPARRRRVRSTWHRTAPKTRSLRPACPL